ncbi:MAG: transketolase [Alphaproteobacteria bacterium]
MDERSLHLRRLAAKALLGGGRGHLPSAMSLIEILRVLYDDVMRYRPAEPGWPERDRCILSKGHGCLALYAILADRGFFPEAVLPTSCRAGSILGGHPERGKVPGVEASTGALGHGLAIGIGQALAARMAGRDSRVFVILGDGEIGEGSVWEGALSAAMHRLGSLTVLIDYNKMQSYGRVADVCDLEPLADKWLSFGFDVREVDGHDVAALRRTFAGLDPAGGRPHCVICHTVKGKGIPAAEMNASWHHKSNLKPAEIAVITDALGDIP